ISGANDSALSTNVDSLSASSTSGSIDITNDGDVSIDSLSAGNDITLATTNDGDVIFTTEAGETSVTADSLTLNVDGSITNTDAVVTDVNSLTATVEGDLNIDNTGDLDLGNVVADSVEIATTGDMTSTGTIVADSADLSGASIDVDTIVGSLTATSKGDVTVSNTGDLEVGDVVSGDSVEIAATGSITSEDETSITANSVDLTADDSIDVNTTAGSLSAEADGDITIAQTGNLELDDMTSTSGSIEVTADGDIVQVGAVLVTGDNDVTVSTDGIITATGDASTSIDSGSITYEGEIVDSLPTLSSTGNGSIIVNGSGDAADNVEDYIDSNSGSFDDVVSNGVITGGSVRDAFDQYGAEGTKEVSPDSESNSPLLSENAEGNSAFIIGNKTYSPTDVDQNTESGNGDVYTFGNIDPEQVSSDKASSEEDEEEKEETTQDAKQASAEEAQPVETLSLN
ncbi:MAG: hypothetical protein R3Y46_04710, partial [Opitutales bacterium]